MLEVSASSPRKCKTKPKISFLR